MSTKRVSTTATARLKQDYMRIMKDPVPYIRAIPLPSNILEWHFAVEGPENTPYEGGIYHGKLVFPREFPFKPPSIYMITPNGRFKCNTRLCLSISDFHPDTWNPAWSVSTILTGLLSFMDEPWQVKDTTTVIICELYDYSRKLLLAFRIVKLEKSPTLGSLETSDLTKRQLSAQSLQFNMGDKVFCELFPDVVEKYMEEMKKREEEMRESSANNNAVNKRPISNLSNSTQDHIQGQGNNNGIFGSALANILVIIGFAVFAYTVRFVLKSVVE